MAQRQSDRQRLALKLESLDDAGIRDVLDLISLIESKSLSNRPRNARDDEFVTTLADAQENKRARQTFEWDVVRRRADRRASVLSSRSSTK